MIPIGVTNQCFITKRPCDLDGNLKRFASLQKLEEGSWIPDIGEICVCLSVVASHWVIYSCMGGEIYGPHVDERGGCARKHESNQKHRPNPKTWVASKPRIYPKLNEWPYNGNRSIGNNVG